jgi:outer membrane lipoprotein carrier protein
VTAAAPAGLPEPARRVQAWLDSWQSLSGRFEQILSSPTLPSDQVESGTFTIMRPDRMRWDYRQPEKKLALTDGTWTWLYLPADRQVIRGRLERLREDSAVSLLLSGSLRLDEAFKVVTAGLAGDGIRLALLPQQESEAIASVDLHATAAGQVLAFTVVDPSGNRVSWRFHELRLDPRVDPARFLFEVPAGVEIQDLEDAGGAAPAAP